MKYISTRGSKREYTFTEAFLESYAEDEGMFCPKDIPQISKEKLAEWSRLSFYDLSLEILSLFIDEEDVKYEDLELILKMSYESFHHNELITMKKIGPISFAELFYGPTYHMKDFSMQFIGQFLKYLVKKDEENDRCHIYGVVVGTDSDTGASMLAGTGFVDFRVNGFCIYPRNKIGYIQEREMISNITSNAHSLCMENSGIAEVLQITRDLVTQNQHKDRMHIISANSCHIARVVCELPILFYTYFHVSSYPKPLAFSIHVANLKTTYSMCLCKEMGLPIEKLIICCKEGSVLERFINEGVYSPQADDLQSEESKTNKEEDTDTTLFIHSNLERVLFYITKESTASVMHTIQKGGKVEVPLTQLHHQLSFVVLQPIPDPYTQKAIHYLYHKYDYLVCPHAATCYASGIILLYKLQQKHLALEEVTQKELQLAFMPSFDEMCASSLDMDQPSIACLNTAHPGKFPYYVADALNAPAGNIMPKDIQDLPLRNSRISVIPNDLSFIRNYITHICFDCVKQFYH